VVVLGSPEWEWGTHLSDGLTLWDVWFSADKRTHAARAARAAVLLAARQVFI